MTYYLHNNGVVRDTNECPGEGLYCKPRPLVVIDPEDREQVKRVLDDYDTRRGVRMNDASEERMAALQAALRSLVTPPKPEEPTGLGAVVEDADGERWVWLSQGAEGAYWYRVGVPKVWRNWRGITAVKVLSEGVTS